MTALRYSIIIAGAGQQLKDDAHHPNNSFICCKEISRASLPGLLDHAALVESTALGIMLRTTMTARKCRL